MSNTSSCQHCKFAKPYKTSQGYFIYVCDNTESHEYGNQVDSGLSCRKEEDKSRPQK